VIIVAVVGMTMSAGFGVHGSTPVASPAASPQASLVMATPESRSGPAILFVAGEITIEISDEGFSPDYFASAVGRDITITIMNAGSRPHNFTMEKLDIDIDLAPGESETVQVDPPDLGTYLYTSSAPGDEGMSGTMTVFI
jgi:plastocyanin